MKITPIEGIFPGRKGGQLVQTYTHLSRCQEDYSYLELFLGRNFNNVKLSFSAVGYLANYTNLSRNFRSNQVMGRKTKFMPSWLSEVVDNVSVSEWCCQDPTDEFRVKCIVWPPPPNQPSGVTFSLKVGLTAIVKHSKTKKHEVFSQ